MIKREYSFISIGTEKNGSDGYMSLSELFNGNRVLSPQGHKINIIDETRNDNLMFSGELSVECMCVIRFQLIAMLSLSDIQNKNVCIFGCGAIGIGAYLECLRLKAKSVILYSRRSEIIHLYNDIINIDKRSNFDEFDILIDCSGDNDNIERIISGGNIGSKVFLLGTPRKSPQIDALLIHRKNMNIHGGHELNGHTQNERREKCYILQNYYMANSNLLDEICKRFVRIHDAKECVLSDIFNHKYLEPFNIMKW